MRVPLTCKYGTELLFNEHSLSTTQCFQMAVWQWSAKAPMVANACEQIVHLNEVLNAALMRDVSLQSAARTS